MHWQQAWQPAVSTGTRRPVSAAADAVAAAAVPADAIADIRPTPETGWNPVWEERIFMNGQLSATQIRYLFAIRELEKTGVVRQGHIAQKLGVSDPSAHKMLLQLERLELIAKKRYSSVFVTEKGREAMERYYSSYTRIRKFFSDGLRLSECNCDKAALAILGGLDEQGADEFCERIVS